MAQGADLSRESFRKANSVKVKGIKYHSTLGKSSRVTEAVLALERKASGIFSETRSRKSQETPLLGPMTARHGTTPSPVLGWLLWKVKQPLLEECLSGGFLLMTWFWRPT